MQALDRALQRYGTQVQKKVAGYSLNGQPSSHYYFVVYAGQKENPWVRRDDDHQGYVASVDLGAASGERPCSVM